ncbi:terminase small subunit [Diaphorobacter ruginosibacter]|uniref:terminase small subunit n=1 Tax=Diaphorobacter ruginosibacter TaxID=1715720 RepID=UPI003342BD1D
MDTNDNPPPQNANPSPPRSIDWVAIEHAYTTTTISLREIGLKQRVTHAAITKRAKRQGWVRPEKEKPVTAKLAALEPRQQLFVQEYLVDMNGTQAAIRAGYSVRTAHEQASRLLANGKVRLAVEEGQKKLQSKLEISAERVVKSLALIATADPRELVEVKTGCCRCCHGEGHKFQRTQREMATDREQWAAKGKPPEDFDEAGGIGFNPLLQPHPECPNCGGDGESRTVLKDTRYLSPQAAALYAGAKQTKYGIEIQMHSQMEAWEKLAKHLGLYAKDNLQRSDPLALRSMSDAERVVRMQRVLDDNPALMETLGRILGGGAE